MATTPTGDDPPDVLLQEWLSDADRASPLARMAALATASTAARPSVRMVTVSEVAPTGLLFYTDGASRKGVEMASNPWAAICFHWPELGRQLRSEGAVAPVDAEASDRYFASRPRGSQLVAAISHQSHPIRDHAVLEQRALELVQELSGHPIPRPGRWSGYRLTPAVFEFWTEGEDRLHHRLRFRLERGGWMRDLLQP